MKHTAVGFFFSWTPDRQLDQYFERVGQAFANLGYDFHIIRATDFLIHKPLYTFNDAFSQKRILEDIEQKNPDFILSINNAGMTRFLQERLKCPIIKWIVDDYPHLFMHDGAQVSSLFGHPNETIVTYTETLRKQVALDFPQVAGRTHFLSHGTETKIKRRETETQDYPISFVGSCLNYAALVNHITKLQFNQRGNEVKRLLTLLQRLRGNYLIDFQQAVLELDLEQTLEFLELNWLELKLMLSDVLTTQMRASALESISDLGLRLFGNHRWLDSLFFNQRLADAFQFERVASQGDLLNVYQRSKISINVPNIQNQTGVGARVFDVLSSNSLLITEHVEESDLHLLFGRDCPILMYRSHHHLRELCEYYLTHENERLELVQQCNALVNDSFSFESRARQMLELANVRPPVDGSVGAMTLIEPDCFLKPSDKGS